MSGFTRLNRLIQFVCFESNVVICLGAGRTCSTSFKLFIEVILLLFFMNVYFHNSVLQWVPLCLLLHVPDYCRHFSPFWRENCDELNYRVAPPTPNCDTFVTSIYTMSWKAMWSVKLDLISQAFGKADAIFFYKSHSVGPYSGRGVSSVPTHSFLTVPTFIYRSVQTLRISPH